MEQISVFNILRIGVSLSSSHTLGPWRVTEAFVEELREKNYLLNTKRLSINLYGSFLFTGKGHITDLAAMLGLSGANLECASIEGLDVIIAIIINNQGLYLGSELIVKFNPKEDIIFSRNFLPFYANDLTSMVSGDDFNYQSTFYSAGGGFIVKKNACEEEQTNKKNVPFPLPIDKAEELLHYCSSEGKKILEIVYKNEKTLRTEEETNHELLRIWNTMLGCTYIGCHAEGVSPGGLHVHRRAYDIHKNPIGVVTYGNPESWINSIRKTDIKFREIPKWVSCLLLAVNEVGVSLGRVVTAPTNGSTGVIPTVLLYYITIENQQATGGAIRQFLLVAGEIGSFFKKGATISAVMGGCQIEIGVSSAMAAEALCELLGGTPEQVLITIETAMEHHSGLTCDSIGGLVQIPYIERNVMGVIKAINATELAMTTDSKNTEVPLDKVVSTTWQVAKSMNSKYEEISEGGLAVVVNIADC